MSAATVAAGGRWLRGVWVRLPDGEWLSERALEELIVRVTGHQAGDWAWAAAIRGSLVASECVTVRRDEAGTLEYRRGEWTDWPANGPGTDAYNQRLQAEHEASLRELERDRRQRWENSPAKAEQDRLVELIDQRIDERIGELRAASHESDSAIARLRERLHTGNGAAA